MTDEEFQKLLEGPLHHPMPQFMILRLASALRTVVDATGDKGEAALKAHCWAREELDALKSGVDMTEFEKDYAAALEAFQKGFNRQ